MRKRPYNERMPTMTAPTLLKRLSRPESPSPFRITERDIEIIRAVARFGYLTSEQIIRYLVILFGPMSHQQVLRRLHLLFGSHHLNRPEHQHLQLSSFSHLVYGLGREGAQLLARLGDPVDPRLQWAAKNSRASATHVLHTLETAQAMLEFERACRSAANLQLLDHAALLPYLPEATRQLDHPFRLRVTTPQDFKTVAINIIPDRVFSIVLPADQRLNFCLELDRGSMSVAARRITSKSSYSRKHLAYWHAWKQDRHREQWGFRGFRVLTVTPSETRIANMIEAQRQVTNDTASGLFLYTTPQRLAAAGAFGDVWTSSEADGISLLDRK